MELDLLGKKVTYLRLDPDGNEIAGHGVVHAVFINEDKRISVRVNDAGQAINCDLVAINAADEVTEKYFEHVRKVRDMAEKANAANREAVEKANREIDDFNSILMGDKVI